MSLLKCNTAIVRDLPKSFVEAVRLDDGMPVDLQRAREQHENYRKTLKRCGLEVVLLEADEKYPDCVFVEDVAVIIGARALITRPGHPSRQGEVDAMREALRGLKHPPEIVEMDDPEALIDGGDVLFTGREIFVGKSSRTDDKGIQCLSRTFPDFPVTSFPVTVSLHLKSFMTMCGPDAIAVGGGMEARQTMEKMKSCGKFPYRYMQMSDDVAANVLLVNECVLIKPSDEIGQGNYRILKEDIQGEIIDVPLSEMYKVNGCLTCCSVLLNQTA